MMTSLLRKRTPPTLWAGGLISTASTGGDESSAAAGRHSDALMPQSVRCYASHRTGSFSMRKIAVAVMFALIAQTALAEDHVPMYGESKDKTEAEKADDIRAERAYQRSLGNVPDQKAVDPWGTARGGEAKKPATPAKPVVKHSSKAKSGSPPN